MKEVKTFVISGINTNCGKTFITGNLAKSLLTRGVNVITHKMVQTGCKGISEDILEHRSLMKIPFFEEDTNGITCPYVFSFPASPHLSASLENKLIDPKKIEHSIQTLKKKYDVILSEGAGGLLVPIHTDYKIADFIREYKYPLILVSSSRLGSINHSLLSIEYCFQYSIDLKAVIYNIFPEDNAIISGDTEKIIKKELHRKFPLAHFLNVNELLKPEFDPFFLFHS